MANKFTAVAAVVEAAMVKAVAVVAEAAADLIISQVRRVQT
jgi:hypothetical protein